MTEVKKKELPSRSDLAVEDKWNLEDIFETDEVWEKEFKEVKQLIPDLAEFQGKLGESAENLVALFKKQDEVLERLGKLYTYAHMRNDEDTSVSKYQALNDRAGNLYTEASSVMSYIVPEILAIDDAVLQKYMDENKELAVYKHAIEEIVLQKPHVLSPNEEALLAQASDALGSSSTTFGMLNNADLKFGTITDEEGHEVEVTHGRYIQFLESPNRQVREDAFKAVYGAYGQFKNTFASTLSGVVKTHNFNAKVRKYKTAREAALSANNIPETVYDQLIETVNKHLPLLHRYIDIRKRALGLEELHMYDLYTPLVPEVKMEFTYKEAQEELLKGLSVMGEEYVDILKNAYEQRWVDVHENKGKRSGAYSSGAYGTNPYILMNWQNNVNNLFTLAHEFGHSVHSYYTRNNQPYVYGDYSIFVAEVASTTNEALLQHYLMNTIDDKKKQLYLVNHYLEGFRGTVFRQTMFAEFEHIIHKMVQDGEALTADVLTEEYYKLNQKYFGDSIVIDKEIGLEWARIPHFYYNYYVYQYATGFSASAALSKQILEEGDEAISRYVSFLKSGSSDYPIEVLKKAGVDMTSSKPIEEALSVFEENLNTLEKLLFQ